MESPEITGPIVALKARRQIAYAPVLVPGEPDADGEVLTVEKVEDAAHNFMKIRGGIDSDHDLSVIDAQVVESHLAREPSVVTLDDGSTLDIPAGTWELGVQVNDPEVWRSIESGERSGFSITAVPKSQLHAALSAVKSGETLKRTLLADVGGGDPNGDWIVPLVSIVPRPAVPKSKWIALKSTPQPDQPGWLARLRRGHQSAKAAHDQVHQEVEDMTPEEVQAMVDAAVKTAIDKQTEPTLEERIEAAVKAGLAPIEDRIGALESPGEGGSEGEGDGGDGLDPAVKSALDQIVERLDQVDQRTQPGSDQPPPSVIPAPAVKSLRDEYDVHGRRVA